VVSRAPLAGSPPFRLMVGGVAGVYYGVPTTMRADALDFLDKQQRESLAALKRYIRRRKGETKLH